jgi:hypothetical protein
VVAPAGPIELERTRAWATIFRVPLAGGRAWFKACGPIQAFEPQLTASLARRWPDRVARVLAHDPERAWLLTADAGDPVAAHGNDPAIWLRALPTYAELQRGEIARVDEHLAAGVPDRRLAILPATYEDLVRADLPLESAEIGCARSPRNSPACAPSSRRRMPSLRSSTTTCTCAACSSTARSCACSTGATPASPTRSRRSW